MFKQVVTFLALTRLTSAIEQNLSGASGFFQHYFAGTDNLRIVSIILLLLAFILFLFLVVILYIKSLLSFIKESEDSFKGGSSSGASQSRQAGVEDAELEKELEKELERDLEATRINREVKTEKQKKEVNNKKQREKQAENVLRQQVPVAPSRSAALEFDWKTGRVGELDELSAGIGGLYNNAMPQTLSELTGLIINMLGRGIDAGKIAQTVKSKAGPLASEEEIIQTIDAIKSFISVANNGKFSQLPDAELLPEPQEALLRLAYGKTDECLSLMEALINNMVDKASQSNMTQKRDIIFLEASNYACIFGSIASIERDFELAGSAFELAIELSPKNANAWSRSGDACDATKTDSKAMLAYQNVLALADENLYPHQIANASKHLAAFYEAQGDDKKAKMLEKNAQRYYEMIGIDKELSIKEQEIIAIIEDKQSEQMPETVEKLLNLSLQKQKQRSFIKAI